MLTDAINLINENTELKIEIEQLEQELNLFKCGHPVKALTTRVYELEQELTKYKDRDVLCLRHGWFRTSDDVEPDCPACCLEDETDKLQAENEKLREDPSNHISKIAVTTEAAYLRGYSAAKEQASILSFSCACHKAIKYMQPSEVRG